MLAFTGMLVASMLLATTACCLHSPDAVPDAATTVPDAATTAKQAACCSGTMLHAVPEQQQKEQRKRLKKRD
jgi:hypothetical protein